MTASAVTPPRPVDPLDHPELPDIHVGAETVFEMLCLLEAAGNVIAKLIDCAGSPLETFFTDRTYTWKAELFPYEDDEEFEERFDVWSREPHEEAFHIRGTELAAQAFATEATVSDGYPNSRATSHELAKEAAGERKRFARALAAVNETRRNAPLAVAEPKAVIGDDELAARAGRGEQGKVGVDERELLEALTWLRVTRAALIRLDARLAQDGTRT